MTLNQLKYAQLQEDKRHNAEMERQEDYKNYSGRLQAIASGNQASASLMQASTAGARLLEDQRHNAESERLESQKIIASGVNAAINPIANVAKTIFSFGA